MMLPTYGELYVVSDIHLGGQRDAKLNFQIFNRGDRLGGLFRYIAKRRVKDDVALVLNGDIIDSLAEDDVPGYVALDNGTVMRMMDRIYNDESFRPVWQGLEELIRTAKRHLVFVVGNHDIELTLPVVEESIRRRLAEGDSDAQSRIHFATHGSGFACRVGEARIFCTHGNEVDEWNWVDYNSLGQLANAINSGRRVDSAKWKPNAGTRLVVDVMNNVKRRYPFVDVLKPEVAAVASIMLALDKDAFKQIDFSDAFPVLRDRVRGGLVTNRLLSADAKDFSQVPIEAVAEEVTAQLLGPSFQEAVQPKQKFTHSASEEELLLSVEHAVAKGVNPTTAIGDSSAPETLGVWDVVSSWVGLVPKVEGLRRALKDWLERDRTFDATNADDDLYRAMQERVGHEVDFVVTGHTHKPRALPLNGGRHYYNCGTWIRTLRLTAEVLDDPEAFERIVWPALNSGRMDDLDNAEIPGPDGSMVSLVMDRTNAVRITAEGTSAKGDLLRVTDGAAKGTVVVELEPGTTTAKVG